MQLWQHQSFSWQHRSKECLWFQIITSKKIGKPLTSVEAQSTISKSHMLTLDGPTTLVRDASKLLSGFFQTSLCGLQPLCCSLLKWISWLKKVKICWWVQTLSDQWTRCRTCWLKIDKKWSRLRKSRREAIVYSNSRILWRYWEFLSTLESLYWCIVRNNRCWKMMTSLLSKFLQSTARRCMWVKLCSL